MVNEYEIVVINGREAILTADGRVIPMVSGSDDAVTPDKEEGDAGGDPDETDDEDDADAEDEDGGDAKSAKDGDGDGTAGNKERSNIPRKRFDRVNAKLKEFRDLGMSATEARSALTEWRQFKDAEKRLRDQEDQTRRDANKDTKREALKSSVFDLIEEDLPGFREQHKQAARDRELFVRGHNANAREALQSLATEAGLVLNERQFKRLQTAMGAEINSNEEILDRFWDPQTMKATVKKVFTTVAEDIYGPALAAANAGKFSTLREKKERNMSRAKPGEGPSVREGNAFESKHPVGSQGWQDEWRVWSNKRTNEILDEHGVA